MNWDSARNEWVKEIIGENKDISNFSDLISEINNKTDDIISTMIIDSKDNIWYDIKWDKSYDMTTSYNRVKAIAVAYSSIGTKYYHDEETKEKILYALQWMNINRYGDSTIRNDGWRDRLAFNWWDWNIGSPSALIDILMLMFDEIPYEKILHYLKPFDFCVPIIVDYGANRMEFARLKIGSAILRRDLETIKTSIDAIMCLFDLCDDGANDGQGMYSDGTYIFHTKHAMNGVYGAHFMKNALRLTIAIDGTEVAFSEEIKKKLINWFEQSILPNYQFGGFIRMFTGRTNSVTLLGANAFEIGLMALSIEPNNTKIKDFIEANIDNVAAERFETICNKLKYAELKAEKIEKSNRLEFSKVYYFGDRVVHQRDDYTFTVAMSSSRVYNYESINHENLKGWYLGDGLTCLYKKNSKQLDEYWNKINPYFMEGTTVDSQEREAVSILQSCEYLSSQDFVGGATIDGKYTASAMALESYHFEGENVIDERFRNHSAEYGSNAPEHICTLTAKKAWFMFDDEIVCLGSDIKSSDNSDVRTVVYNNQNDCICESGIVNIPELCSIEFLNGTEYSKREFDEYKVITIEHGKNPKNAKYAYVIYPNKKTENICVLENSSIVQAVTNKALGLAEYVFWSEGECENVRASKPCILIVSKNKIAVADPTHKLDNLTLEIDNKKYEVLLKGTNGKTIEIMK